MKLTISTFLIVATGAIAAEYHVGSDHPYKTIMAAAEKAMPGDTITVHEGIYREQITPPRGGTSDELRITYQAAKGEKVVITGAEQIKGWEPVENDTWKVTIPAEVFGDYNPFADRVYGDYFISKGNPDHTGSVYLNGEWLREVFSQNAVLAPAAAPLGHWFATAPGKSTAPLLNLAWFSTGDDTQKVPAINATALGNARKAESNEGGGCLGYIYDQSWATFKGVALDGVTKLRFRVAVDPTAGVPGSQIEIRLNGTNGDLLGTATTKATENWQSWSTIEADIKPTKGSHDLTLVFKDKPAKAGSPTTLWAQFKGVDPNKENVEIAVRPTVFSPDKPGINYITVRGFILRQAATNWAPPTAGQIGIVSAYWNKGWIIEDNEISHTVCSGVALGKYHADGDNHAGNNSQVYTETIDHALKNGWNKDTIGSHIVRNNHIHHCEQVGIVGSMGCAFSIIEGNEIHDIHVRHAFSGYEQAGIKFHGLIDGVIRNNHIYNTGCFGIWLDWMCQGTQVTGNFFHDNLQEDMFLEMQHGPMLIANNLIVSKNKSLFINSKSMAFAHNLITGGTNIHHTDERRTPYHKAHSTEIVDLYPAPGGDHRFYNNLLTNRADLAIFDKSPLPSVAGGNVYTQGATVPTFDKSSYVKADFQANPTLIKKEDGWYLSIIQDPQWKNHAKSNVVTTELLGKAKIPNLPYENSDATPLTLDTDYFGNARDKANPFPGPFEKPINGEIKVWPKP